MLQPVKIGCVWAADGDGGADLKVLRQFTACLLETVPSEEEQTPKASKREKRDQQSECRRLVGTGGAGAPGCPGPRETRFCVWIKTRKVFHQMTEGTASIRSLVHSRAGQPLQLARFPRAPGQGHAHPCRLCRPILQSRGWGWGLRRRARRPSLRRDRHTACGVAVQLEKPHLERLGLHTLLCC